MPLQKQSLPINFAHGVDTKTDPKAVSPGKFLSRQNTIFSIGNLLQKRNGFKKFASLPDATSMYATSLNDNLTAVGPTFRAYSQATNTWVDRGKFHPLQLTTTSTVTTNTNQTQVDSAISANGLMCTVFTDQIPISGTNTPSYKYMVTDQATAQYIISPTVISVPSGAVSGSPRVCVLGNYFVIVFPSLISAVNHVQFFAISIINPTTVTSVVNITSAFTPASSVNFDIVVANNIMYVAWNGNDTSVKVSSVTAQLVQNATVSFSSQVATIMGLSADTSTSTPVIWVSYYDSASQAAKVLAISQNLATVLAPTSLYTSVDMANITCVAKNMICTVIVEINNAYTYDSSVKTNFIQYKTVTQAGVVGSNTLIARSVGLASKAFYRNNTIYFLTAYSSPLQPTYFLMKLTGEILARLAYSNGGGYLKFGLPSVTVTGNLAQVSYLFKDLIQAANKQQGVLAVNGIYAQTGINMVSFTIGTPYVYSNEIGQNLNLTGGFLWGYDGNAPTENGFNVWPDSVEITTATTGGFLTAQQYYYQVVYEWSDNAGNIYRSAPSVPVTVTTTGSTSKNTLHIPTLRLSYKAGVKIVVYRWSVAQQSYYQVSSILTPTLNDPTTDSIDFVDTLADSSILGNTLIYTTGGVVENICGPSPYATALFRARLFIIDSEDRNLLWYSKEVIERTPVEMSDLFTLFVAPNTAAQGATGPMYAISSMDDKLIIFKKNSIYYLVGNGPDNTGANNDFTDPVFITSTVGCINQESVVFTPEGLMFQSNGKGIWLLSRDLSTSYIGAPVQAFNDYTVVSAVNVPGTNEVRFTMSNGSVLSYDYYYDQWGEFTGISSISSTIVNNLHTFINAAGEVYQENPGSYLDGSKPVLMSFETGWINLAGLSGYERAYFFFLLGQYLSPHTLSIEITYDYAPSASQQVTLTPSNYDGFYGDYPLYGSSEAFSKSDSEFFRVFFETQKCKAFKIKVTESYDSTHGGTPGAGFTMSGINLIYGIKKSYATIGSDNSAG